MNGRWGVRATFCHRELDDMVGRERSSVPWLVTAEEIRAAWLQFVRKISGFNKPSKTNEGALLVAVDEIAGISTRLLRTLQTNAPPKNREEEATKAKARAAKGFGAESAKTPVPLETLIQNDARWGYGDEVTDGRISDPAAAY